MLAIGVVLTGCRTPLAIHKPSISILHVPAADPGGPVQLDFIEGRTENAVPGQKVVLYAHSGVWWVQPTKLQAITKIQADGSWKNSTHLGTEYGALLVTPDYQPASKMAALPAVGNEVLAVAMAQGVPAAPIVSKTLHFSGFDWSVRASASDRGGSPNSYDPGNAWTDEKGYLHLRMLMRNGGWSCAEVNLKRSLGFGTYRLVVQDSAHLDPSAVLGFFTWDELGSDENRSELDIELSRWGNPEGKNAQYVVQPFYVPENVSRFTVPAGELTHILRWEPGSASFKTIKGSVVNSEAKSIGEHTFTAGVPTPTAETVHIDLYEFHHARSATQQPAEVVIEKFEYLP